MSSAQDHAVCVCYLLPKTTLLSDKKIVYVRSTVDTTGRYETSQSHLFFCALLLARRLVFARWVPLIFTSNRFVSEKFSSPDDDTFCLPPLTLMALFVLRRSHL